MSILIRGHRYLDQGIRLNRNDPRDKSVEIKSISEHADGYTGFSHDDLSSVEKRSPPGLSQIKNNKKVHRGVKRILDQVRVHLDAIWGNITDMRNDAGITMRDNYTLKCGEKKLAYFKKMGGQTRPVKSPDSFRT